MSPGAGDREMPQRVSSRPEHCPPRAGASARRFDEPAEAEGPPVKSMGSARAGREPAKFQLVGPDVFRGVAGRHSGRPGFEHEHAEATLGDLLGRPAAARTRPDDEDVMPYGVD
jgi:hypothetical protein